MKFGCVLSLSVKNIFLKKSAYLKAVAGFFFAFLIIFTVLFYSGSLNTAYNDYLNVNASYLVYNVNGGLTKEQEQEIRAFPQVKSIYSYSEVYSVYDSETEVTIGGRKHVIGREEYSFYGGYIGRNSDYPYCENKFLSFNEETGEQFLVCGETLKNDNDILVSEKLLNYFNIEERESLIGKEILISGVKYGDEWIDDEREQLPYSKSGVIRGIVNGNFGYFNYICFADDITVATDTLISLNTFTGNEDFFAKMDEMFGEEVSHRFEGQYRLDNLKTVEGQQSLCNRFLSLIAVVLFVVICVYVASNQFYLLQKNSTFYGILKANGVDNKSIFLTHMFEIAITLLVALVLAFAVGVGAFFIIKALFDDFLGIDLAFSAGIAFLSFFGLVAVCALLAFLITLFIYNKILKKPPVQLLRK